MLASSILSILPGKSSMYSTAVVCPPAPTFAQGLTTIKLGTPIYQRAVEQHEAYCSALEHCGLSLVRMEPDERYPDSTFVEDVAVVTKRGAILTRPGATSRMGEVEVVSEVLGRFFPKLSSIRNPGSVDGGDICDAGDHFFIGLSERTNNFGAEQLADWLATLGYSSSLVDIRDVAGILHLKSGIAYLDDNRMLVIDALSKRPEFRGYETVRVQSGEEYAANCVRLNDYVLVAAGYPYIQNTLRELGYQTIALEMTEFHKMDGGLSCLSLRF
jgi:dimethylargininase